MKRDAADSGEQSQRAVVPIDQDRKLFEEIAALNNELLTAQRELARRNAELVRLNEQKNMLLGIAAHDLRNPIAAIYSCSEFLLSETGNFDPDQLEMLRAVQGSSEFMLQLIEDVLHLSRMESGKIELRIQRFNPTELVTRHVALNRPIAARKNISIELELDSGLPELEADTHKFEQVLENLISNAVKFSPQHTVVKVSMRRDAHQLKLAV